MASYIYTLLHWTYTTLFYCKRQTLATFFQEDTPRKVLEIEIPTPSTPWVAVFGERDGRKHDVTDLIDDTVTELSVKLLEDVSGIYQATWTYVDSQTFEVVSIVPTEKVNECPVSEPANDPVPSVECT